MPLNDRYSAKTAYHKTAGPVLPGTSPAVIVVVPGYFAHCGRHNLRDSSSYSIIPHYACASAPFAAIPPSGAAPPATRQPPQSGSEPSSPRSAGQKGSRLAPYPSPPPIPSPAGSKPGKASARPGALPKAIQPPAPRNTLTPARWKTQKAAAKGSRPIPLPAPAPGKTPPR